MKIQLCFAFLTWALFAGCRTTSTKVNKVNPSAAQQGEFALTDPPTISIPPDSSTLGSFTPDTNFAKKTCSSANQALVNLRTQDDDWLSGFDPASGAYVFQIADFVYDSVKRKWQHILDREMVKDAQSNTYSLVLPTGGIRKFLPRASYWTAENGSRESVTSELDGTLRHYYQDEMGRYDVYKLVQSIEQNVVVPGQPGARPGDCITYPQKTPPVRNCRMVVRSRYLYAGSGFATESALERTVLRDGNGRVKEVRNFNALAELVYVYDQSGLLPISVARSSDFSLLPVQVSLKWAGDDQLKLLSEVSTQNPDGTYDQLLLSYQGNTSISIQSSKGPNPVETNTLTLQFSSGSDSLPAGALQSITDDYSQKIVQYYEVPASPAHYVVQIEDNLINPNYPTQPQKNLILVDGSNCRVAEIRSPTGLVKKYIRNPMRSVLIDQVIRYEGGTVKARAFSRKESSGEVDPIRRFDIDKIYSYESTGGSASNWQTSASFDVEANSGLITRESLGLNAEETNSYEYDGREESSPKGVRLSRVLRGMNSADQSEVSYTYDKTNSGRLLMKKSSFPSGEESESFIYSSINQFGLPTSLTIQRKTTSGIETETHNASKYGTLTSIFGPWGNSLQRISARNHKVSLSENGSE